MFFFSMPYFSNIFNLHTLILSVMENIWLRKYLKDSLCRRFMNWNHKCVRNFSLFPVFKCWKNSCKFLILVILVGDCVETSLRPCSRLVAFVISPCDLRLIGDFNFSSFTLKKNTLSDSKENMRKILTLEVAIIGW